MKIAIAHLVSISPYSQSRPHETPKLERETSDAYEQRTWRDKCHALPDGHLFIPPMAFKMGLDAAASMLGMQIPGKGKKTYTKFFLSGVLVTDPIILPNKKDDIPGDRIYANADGVRGSGKRVWRTFPRVDEWRGKVTYHVLADEITEEVFEKNLKQAGSFVGIGRFRAQNGGTYGRYRAEKIEWQEV